MGSYRSDILKLLGFQESSLGLSLHPGVEGGANLCGYLKSLGVDRAPQLYVPKLSRHSPSFYWNRGEGLCSS